MYTGFINNNIIGDDIISTIRCHHDADGITTAYFTKFHVKNGTIEIWNGNFGEVRGLKAGDWLVDMRPTADLEGLTVIDHHPPHPLTHKYTLHFKSYPASLIAWEMFKEEIPKKEWWKLAIGLVGDAAPELIPYEVFESKPELLVNIKTSAHQSYGKWKVNYYPVYKLLSSGINALLRLGDFDRALRIIKTVDSPFQLLQNKEIKLAKARVSAEFERIMREQNCYEFDNLIVCLFRSDIRMSGYISSSMLSGDTPAIMSINLNTNRGSLRGELASYWKAKLSNLNYLTIDGHSSAMGVSLHDSPMKLIEDITNKINLSDI